MIVRPKHFQLDRSNPLAKGLVFGGLGFGAGASTMFDSSLYKNNGTLTNMDPASDWVFIPELGRWGTSYTGINQTIPTSNCLSLTTPLTLCGWAMCPTTPAFRDALCPLWKPNEFLFGLYRGYYGGSQRNSIAAATYDATNSDWRLQAVNGEDDAIAEWVVGEWVHLAFQIVSRTRVLIWVNGTNVFDGFSNNYGSFAATTNSLSVRGPGYLDNVNDYADGSIADPMGYSRILTPTEIADLADPTNRDLNHMLDWGQVRKRYFLPPSSPATSIIPIVTYYQRLMNV